MPKLATLFVAAALFGFATSMAQAEEPNGGAARFVESLGGHVVALFRSQDIESGERSSRLQELLRANVDLERIGRYILSDHWEDATPEQRSEYQALFATYALSTFAHTLAKHGIDGFAVIGADDVKGSLALVHTRVEGAEGEAMQWSWKVQRQDGNYRAVDLIADGISMARTYRSEIGTVVGNLGMDALLRILRFKTSQASNVFGGAAQTGDLHPDAGLANGGA